MYGGGGRRTRSFGGNWRRGWGTAAAQAAELERHGDEQNGSTCSGGVCSRGGCKGKRRQIDSGGCVGAGWVTTSHHRRAKQPRDSLVKQQFPKLMLIGGRKRLLKVVSNRSFENAVIWQLVQK